VSCSVLQFVIYKLQDTARHCRVLQDTARHCKTLQDTARHCKTLPDTARHCNTRLRHARLVAHCRATRTVTLNNTPQHAETHCNTLHHNATHCSTHVGHALQPAATRCNTHLGNARLIALEGRANSHVKQYTATHAATRCNTLQNTLGTSQSRCTGGPRE